MKKPEPKLKYFSVIANVRKRADASHTAVTRRTFNFTSYNKLHEGNVVPLFFKTDYDPVEILSVAEYDPSNILGIPNEAIEADPDSEVPTRDTST